MSHVPSHPRFREKVHASFDRQGLMQTLGARIRRVDPGEVEIELPFSRSLTQQHGFFHAAAVAATADTAGGYAALTLMGPDEEVLAAEFKINLFRPAAGDLLVAEAAVVRAGRSLVVCEVNVSTYGGRSPGRVAIMLQTNFRVSAVEYGSPRAGE